MAEESNDAKTSQFVALTEAPAETAAFYLDSCNGDVEAAINAYFANVDAPSPASLLPPRPNVREEEASAGDGTGYGSGKGPGRQSREPSGRGGNIRGFSDLGVQWKARKSILETVGDCCVTLFVFCFLGVCMALSWS